VSIDTYSDGEVVSIDTYSDGEVVSYCTCTVVLYLS